MEDKAVDKKDLTVELIGKFKARALESFYFFSRYVMGNEYIVPHVHGEISQWMAGVRGGNVRKFGGVEFSGKLMLVLSSRDLLKTTFIAQYYPLWKIANNPDIRILLDSETRDLSMETLKAIKYIIEGSEVFRATFGDLNGGVSGNAWNQEGIRVATRKDIKAKEDTIETSGIDVAKTGRHYFLIIMDDLHSERNTKTPEQIDKVIEHIKLTLPLLDKDGELIIIGSLWNDSDAYNWLKELKDDNGDCLFDIFTKPAEIDGVPTYPERLPAETLAMKKLIMGDTYSAQYLVDPVPLRDADFNKNELKFIETDKLPKDLNYFMMCDTVGDKKDSKGSWFATVTWGLGKKMDELGHYELYLIDGVCGGLNIAQQIDAITSLYMRTRPLELGIEKAGMSTLKLHLDNALKPKGLFLNTAELKPEARAKNDRIRQFIPFARNGMVYINKGCNATFVDEFLYEWQRFPKAKRLDVLDASAYIFDFARRYPPSFRNSLNYVKNPENEVRGIV